MSALLALLAVLAVAGLTVVYGWASFGDNGGRSHLDTWSSKNAKEWP